MNNDVILCEANKVMDTTFSDGAKSFPQAVLTRTYHKSVHVC